MTADIFPSTLCGSITVPPSKSMAHRLLICAALAGGSSFVENLDYSEDILATLGALRQLGARFNCAANSATVQGAHIGSAQPTGAVHCGESGSTLRFMVPLFGLLGQPVHFTGAARLFQRPLGSYAHIFARQGLPFSHSAEGLRLCGPLHSGRFELAGNVSSQFISGLLFALPLLQQDSSIHITPPFESRGYVELTRRAQALFGVHSSWQNQHTLHIPGKQQYTPARCRVEGDWSQAVVPAALASVCGGISIAGLSENTAQGDAALLSILLRSGAKAAWQQDVLHITPPAKGLHAPGEVDLADCPDLGPVLCAWALFCSGSTHFINAGRLRIKESDRIETVETELRKLGGQLHSTQNSITVQGGSSLLPGQTLQSHNDHRVAMAAATAALGAGLSLRLEGAQAVRKSWPGFFTDMQGIGAKVVLHD